ncbi:MAG: hypothetical protein SVZ03_08310 [Spirochaetota bacterium]|nr:hypothetical protein [Spirochaetota bacterium]
MCNEEIILCQTDSQKGCCACCGLFNFRDVSRENLTNFLRLGKERLRQTSKRTNDNWEEYIESIGIRDQTSHICPYQGLIISNKPGCMLHPKINDREMRDISLFGSKICNDFLCAAHYILSNEQKRILIRYIEDWYLYSVAIIDPESFIWILRYIEKKYKMNDKNNQHNNKYLQDILCTALEIHSRYLKDITCPIFYYSNSEYDDHKHLFSLKSRSKKISKHRRLIENEISRLMK